jgi:NAD(P)-dependent dehydrogenase (short-subunit alcohol dehydrogenase family)
MVALKRLAGHNKGMSQRFAGKVALITGATGGLGRPVTLAFLEEGAHVIAADQSSQGLEALTKTAGIAANLQTELLNATDETAVHAFVKSVLAKHKRLDVLVNTIGGYAGGIKLWELDRKTYDLMFTLNLHAGFTLAQAVVPVMLKLGSGAIVNIGARAALDHAAGASAYAASKAASVALFGCLAQDLKGTGIRVNSVLPSIIDTEANRRAMPDADFSKWPKPEEIARVILFLCSDDAKLIHGTAIPVYGQS